MDEKREAVRNLVSHIVAVYRGTAAGDCDGDTKADAGKVTAGKIGAAEENEDRSSLRKELSSSIFKRNEVPDHVSGIRELDFSVDLFTERLEGPWFRLGAQTMREPRNERGAQEAVSRQSLLLAPEGFADAFDKLESVGNVLSELGKPGGVIRERGRQRLRLQAVPSV